MNTELQAITADTTATVRELAEAAGLRSGQLLVIGVSTSEVAGRRIGTSGTQEIAQAIYEGIEAVRRERGFYPVYQCCEHLNRALVLTREAAERYRLEEVAAVPIPGAGGSMAAYSYRMLNDPVLVDAVQADAGIDIGDTLIGMHLRRVAVPLRPAIRSIGAAHVTMATTRPRLIGGARAVYTLDGQPVLGEAESAPEQRGGTCD
ncbi:TIGR01440 family protein [Paenibacillus sp. 1P07SE]|uniref:TIGR01440 family protein n=1 Tax=Paenibacillus sp. 1P07SE TaxID=3132209 RepID=UPI0039A5247C